MGWLKELRSSLENPSTPLSYPAEWLLDIFNGGRTDSGLRVSQMTALNVSTVYACVDLISDQIARAPLNVYERLQPRGKRVAFEHDVYFLLHDEPNPEMTSFTFRKTLMCHKLLWGNLFAEIQRDIANRPVALWPRNPAKTRPYRLLEPINVGGDQLNPGALVYLTSEGVTERILQQDEVPHVGSERLILASDMLHVPGLSLDGRLGQDVVYLARQIIGLALAAEKYGAKFFANGARPGLLVTVPQAMKPDAIENFKRSIQEAAGGENIHRPFILEAGMTAELMKTANNEAQFIETRQDIRMEICAEFHVPPHMVGLVDKSSGRANMEQMGQEFVTTAIAPHSESINQEGTRKLFPKRGASAGKYFISFDLHELMLPDAASRGDYYAKGKQWGYLCTDDIRDWEGLNPIGGPEGEKFWKPVNMMDADESLAPSMTPKDGAGTVKPGEQEAERYIRAYFRLFSDRFSAYLARDKRDLEACRKVFLPILSAIAAGIRMNTAPLLGVDGDAEQSETESMLTELVSGMHKRSAEWKAEDGVVRAELARAVRAIKIAVYRDLATAKAKAESSIQGDNSHEA